MFGIMPIDNSLVQFQLDYIELLIGITRKTPVYIPFKFQINITLSCPKTLIRVISLNIIILTF